jgi:hypothetical protein
MMVSPLGFVSHADTALTRLHVHRDPARCADAADVVSVGAESDEWVWCRAKNRLHTGF